VAARVPLAAGGDDLVAVAVPAAKPALCGGVLACGGRARSRRWVLRERWCREQKQRAREQIARQSSVVPSMVISGIPQFTPTE